jgi:AcrR family transcriptional regulator
MARTIGSDGATTEKAIAKAAVGLIARYGFAAVSLRELANEVGLQPGSIYRYYASKNDLLVSVMKRHLQDLLKAWQAANPGDADPAARLDAFIRFHLQYHADKSDEVIVANMELRSLGPEDLGEITALRSDYEAELRRILVEGNASGTFLIPDIQVATFGILAMLTGPTLWYREGGRLSRDDLARHYAGLIRNGIVSTES